MFSALKKLTRSGEERCVAPMPMSSSLQKKFSKGVHFNMKILIKGDRNVGKSCLLQRLQGGPFIEDYVPTDQIQVAPIHWTYKNTDYIVKVEVWEVVDKGRTKKKPPLGLKLENQSTTSAAEEAFETPVLDATFLDVYKNATGVILMLDITKPWTFDYVVKELAQVPADLPVVVLGNHCDMQHHRQVHPHHIEQALYNAKMNRTGPVRYAESSMRNGFGLRLLHKFLSVPFLRLQRASLLEQLRRNQTDMDDIENELDQFQNSEECEYKSFVDRLANKRRQSAGDEPRPAPARSPSIVLGAGKPIVPRDLNPLVSQALSPPAPKPEGALPKQKQFVSPELTGSKHLVSMDVTPPRLDLQDSAAGAGAGGELDEFYAGALDSSFLDDLTPVAVPQHVQYDTDSDDDTGKPKVIVDQDELDIEVEPSSAPPTATLDVRPTEHVVRPTEHVVRPTDHAINPTDNVLRPTDVIRPAPEDINRLMSRASITNDSDSIDNIPIFERRSIDLSMDNDFPLWAGDSSARRSPEGGEDPEPAPKEPEKEKKKSKKKSKDKDRGDCSDKSDRKEKKHKLKKSKSERKTSNPQQDLLAPTADIAAEFNYEEYDSI